MHNFFSKEILEKRFDDFRTNPVLRAMTWIDPLVWTDELDFANDDIRLLANHFELPLKYAGFELQSALKEWKNFR